MLGILFSDLCHKHMSERERPILVDVCYLKPQVAPENLVLKILRKLVLLRIACIRIKTVYKARPILRALPLKARYRQINFPIIRRVITNSVVGRVKFHDLPCRKLRPRVVKWRQADIVISILPCRGSSIRCL